MQFDLRRMAETRAYLKEMQEEGNSFASYLAEGPLTKEVIACFSGIYEAAEHSYENTTDYDRYVVCRIKELVQALEAIVSQKQKAKQDNVRDKSLKRAVKCGGRR